MSNQTVSVPVSPVPTLINPGLTVGSIIYNQDTTDTVWISADPSITSGSGIPLGPLGHMTWKGGAVYAIADSAATSAILLNLSSDVGNLDNPVAIGAAVASQLLAKGVPNVLVGNMLVSGDIYGNPIPNLSPGSYTWGFRDIDVSAYASLTISINPQAAAQVSASFDSTITGAGASLGGFDFPITGAIGGSVTFVIPVTGPYLNFIVNSTIIPYSYSIYGSNRPVDKPRILNGYSVQQNWNLSSVAFHFAQPVQLGTFLSNGKACWLRLVVAPGSATTNRGKFGYTSFDGQGNITNVDIVDTSLAPQGEDGQETEEIIYLPPGRLGLFYFPLNDATYTVVASIVQEIA